MKHEYKVVVEFYATTHQAVRTVQAESFAEACEMALDDASFEDDDDYAPSHHYEATPSWVSECQRTDGFGSCVPERYSESATLWRNHHALATLPQGSQHRGNLRLAVGPHLTALEAGLEVEVPGKGYVLLPWADLRRTAHNAIYRGT